MKNKIKKLFKKGLENAIALGIGIAIFGGVATVLAAAISGWNATSLKTDNALTKNEWGISIDQIQENINQIADLETQISNISIGTGTGHLSCVDKSAYGTGESCQTICNREEMQCTSAMAGQGFDARSCDSTTAGSCRCCKIDLSGYEWLSQGSNLRCSGTSLGDLDVVIGKSCTTLCEEKYNQSVNCVGWEYFVKCYCYSGTGTTSGSWDHIYTKNQL